MAFWALGMLILAADPPGRRRKIEADALLTSWAVKLLVRARNQEVRVGG
jgi:hypothetical protein